MHACILVRARRLHVLLNISPLSTHHAVLLHGLVDPYFGESVVGSFCESLSRSNCGFNFQKADDHKRSVVYDLLS